MIIKKGQTFIVKDRRKGTFEGTAIEDFDTEKDEFYPVKTLEFVGGMANEWKPGERIPCRRGIAIIVLEA